MTEISKRPLHQEVAQRIRVMIRNGDLNRGDRIVEKDLCAALGISRTPLREALRYLTSEGLIKLVPHRGAFVAEPSIQEIRAMFEVMSILEGYCAARAAEKMSEGDLQKLERLHSKLEHYHEVRNGEKYLEVNHRLHSLVQELAGNPVLNELINGLRQKILLYRHRQLYQPDRFDASMNEHRDLMAAFRRRNGAMAENSMRAHLIHQCEALESLYEDETKRAGTKHR